MKNQLLEIKEILEVILENTKDVEVIHEINNIRTIVHLLILKNSEDTEKYNLVFTRTSKVINKLAA